MLKIANYDSTGDLPREKRTNKNTLDATDKLETLPKTGTKRCGGGLRNWVFMDLYL